MKLAAVVLMALVAPSCCATQAAAQVPDHDHHHDHHHGALHFTHPLVTESPSPDTKLRVDFGWSGVASAAAAPAAREVQVELEDAFSPSLSVAVTLPYEWRTKPGAARASGFGSTELSLKAASYALANRGVLLGGGLSTALPTGSDVNSIGDNHAVELEPFVYGAYMRGDVELVTFASYSTLTRRSQGQEQERELTGNGAALYHVGEHAQVLVEVASTRALAGTDRGRQLTSLAPGLEVVPWVRRPLMFGISFAAPVSHADRNERRVLVSAFYHF